MNGIHSYVYKTASQPSVACRLEWF